MTARQTQSRRELLTHFTAGLCLSSHFHILTAHHFHPTPWTWKTHLHPKRWLLVVSGRWSISPAASWGRPELKPEFLPVWWAMLLSPRWLLHPTGFHCASEALTPTLQEDESPFWIKLSIGAWWSLFPVVGETHLSDKRGDNSLCLCNPGRVPKKCCGRLLAEIRNSEAV
jgi:hypothetical protein